MSEFQKEEGDVTNTDEKIVHASPSTSSPSNQQTTIMSPNHQIHQPKKFPCKYFAMGKCNKGDSCRFIHDQNAYNNNMMRMQSSQPKPVMINLKPGTPVFSIDVECVATSTLHNARSIAHIAMVDEWCRPVCSLYVKQEKKVASYLTPVTGVTAEIIEKHGMFLSDALIQLRQHLPPNAVLVGQNIKKDVEWLNLAEGLDFASMIDLVALFRVWNIIHNGYTVFSQDHVAKVWLGYPERETHDALNDAAISMSLFNAYRTCQFDENNLRRMQMLTLETPRTPSYSATHPTIDGCCLGHRKTCSCGAPFFISS